MKKKLLSLCMINLFVMSVLAQEQIEKTFDESVIRNNKYNKRNESNEIACPALGSDYDRKKIDLLNLIEIQRKSEDFFDWRLFYYGASLLSRQLSETDPYSKLKPVIILGILNFKLYSEFDEPVSHHMMCDMRSGRQSINLIELHIVELGKFNKKVDQLVTAIDKWLFFLKEAHDQVNIPAVYDDTPSIRQAFDALARWNWKPEQVASYDREVLEFQIQITQELAQVAKIKEGIANIAINMLKKSMSHEDIADVTGLSIEQIAELAKNRL